MAKKSVEKRQLILSKALELFVRKGFHAVTMSDIVEECQISRGGLYRYYSSTDDIFRELLRANAIHTEEIFESMMGAGEPYREIMELFLSGQKAELRQINNSMMTAAYEFFLSHKSNSDREFLQQQYIQSAAFLSRLIQYGNERKETEVASPDTVANQLLIFLEGLRVLGLSVDLTDEFLEEQFKWFQNNLFGGHPPYENNPYS
ncbi:TetR/AcrR family transcriptional regulator [Paenibacillus sp. FSL M7-1046]|uniref:TetR/AcrR family transcriptional regulator n=1 Tax=Paenibacillus sp. FSL M7-1046 TaxID=2975315 RepID=UPI0030F69664